MSKKSKTIIITGTHITPAIELINQLQADPKVDWHLHYIGRQYTSPIEKIPAIEYEIIPKMGVNYHIIDCGKFDRRYWPNTILGLPKTIKGIFQAIAYVRQIKPDVVISFGGYLSVPVIFASKLFNIPSITHEQTQTISLSTRLNALFTTKVALSFNKSLDKIPKNKTVVTGNLLRSNLYNSTSSLFSKLISKPTRPVIYVTAGNQGSHKINQAILKLLPQLLDKFIIIHQTGKLDYPQICRQTSHLKNYFAFDYITQDDIGWVFHHASLIISRSGANATQEISAFGTPAILIPLPITQQNEQKLNASWLQSNQPHHTLILDDLKLTPDLLLEAITQLKSQFTQGSHQPTLPINYQLFNLVNEIC